MNESSLQSTVLPPPDARPAVLARRSLLIAWMALIFALSADPQSGQKTGWILASLLAFAHIQLGAAQWALVHHLVRKAAHVTVYAVLGLLWSWNLPGRPVLAWLLAALYAGTDEFHQIFVPTRGASMWDVVLDSSSAGLALALAQIRSILN